MMRNDVVILDARFFRRTPVRDIDEVETMAQFARISPP